ncbi:alanine racemase [candidate division KSB1 bacterium]
MNRRGFIQAAGLLSAGIFSCGRDVGSTYEAPPVRYGSGDPWLEVNLRNIETNIRLIKKKVSDRPVMAVVKCNAYGHGLVEVGKYLESINIDALLVGKLQEALELRYGGIRTPVLNFGPFSEPDAESVVAHDISQTVYDDSVLVLDSMAERLRKQALVHILVDSGLGRVGVSYRSAVDYIQNVAQLVNVKIEGVFTTFTEDVGYDRVQLQRFLGVCENAENRGIALGIRHAASSAGVLVFPEAYLDMVRPGICIYGLYPSDEEARLRKIDLEPALSLKTRVSHVKTLRRGDSVSYHRLFTAEKEEKLVTAALGYSDGIPLNSPGRASALIGGKKFPVVIDVSANHSYMNVTGNDNIRTGDEIVIFGEQEGSEITAHEFAQAVDTSVYKIVILQNPLMKREFIT